MKHVIIVGGGAAGMMAAVHLAHANIKVTLIEKNEKLGKKLFITGKGRCNVTNNCDVEDLFSNMVGNEKFMYSSFYSYSPQDVMEFFEKLGVRLKTERGNRVFPVSDHSSDIISALENDLKKHDVTIMKNSKVKNLILDEQRKGVKLENDKEIIGDYILLSTGGVSYPLTGSTGDGHEMVKNLGHKITPLLPALVPLEIKESWCMELQGLSLKNVAVTIKDGKKVLFEEFGEMLFTHFGVSGPLIITGSSYVTERLNNANEKDKKDKNQELKLYIDLKPALSKEQLDKRFIREFEENNRKSFKNVIPSFYPAKLVPVITKLAGIDPECKVYDINREMRQKLVDLTKCLELTITKTRPMKEAIITKGGISLKDVNPSTMESKLVNNLYFAGEVLDLDALTGGFNLQIAWSTAYIAATSIIEDKYIATN